MAINKLLQEKLETLHSMTFVLAKKSSDLDIFIQHLNTPGANINIVDYENNSLLHIVSTSGNIKFLEELLKRNISLNIQNAKGDTALHIAARLNDVSISKKLLDAGADSIIENYQDQLPLELTDNSLLRNIFEHILNKLFFDSVVKDKAFMAHYALIKGANINVYDRYANNALYFAIINNSTKLVTTLLEHNINVNWQNIDHITPLHMAARNLNLEITKALLSVKELNLDAKDINNQTPIHYAIKQKSSIAQEIALLLIKKGSNPFITGENDFSLLYKASFQGFITLLKEILKQDNHFYINQQNNPYNFSALHAAAVSNQEESMYELINAGIDITLKAYDGNTAYKLAKENQFIGIADYLKNGAIALISASANGNLTLVKKLLPKTKINISEKYGFRAIDLAAKFGHYDVVEYLLSKKASIKADKEGNTALHLAAENKHCNVLELFASKGENLHQANLLGKTPHELAQECFE